MLARILGGPTIFRIERFVPGHVAHHDLIGLVNSVPWALAQDGGEVQQIPEGVGWRHKSDEGPLTQVEMTRFGDGTRLRLLAKYEDPGAWTLIGAGVLTAAGSFATIAFLDPSIAAGAGIVTGFAGASMLAARAFWRNASARLRRRFTGLIDRLERQTAELVARTEPDQLPEAPIADNPQTADRESIRSRYQPHAKRGDG